MQVGMTELKAGLEEASGGRISCMIVEDHGIIDISCYEGEGEENGESEGEAPLGGVLRVTLTAWRQGYF